MSSSLYSEEARPPSASKSHTSFLLEETEERIIDVWDFLQLKRVAENSDNELSIVGTFIQGIVIMTHKLYFCTLILYGLSPTSILTDSRSSVNLVNYPHSYSSLATTIHPPVSSH